MPPRTFLWAGDGERMATTFRARARPERGVRPPRVAEALPARTFGTLATVEGELRCSPEAVLAVLADGWSYATWVAGTARDRGVDADWPGPGSQIAHSAGIWPAVIDNTTISRAWDPGGSDRAAGTRLAARGGARRHRGPPEPRRWLHRASVRGRGPRTRHAALQTAAFGRARPAEQRDAAKVSDWGRSRGVPARGTLARWTCP